MDYYHSQVSAKSSSVGAEFLRPLAPWSRGGDVINTGPPASASLAPGISPGPFITAPIGRGPVSSLFVQNAFWVCD